MDDWRSPKAKMKQLVKSPLYALAVQTGRYVRQPPSQQETVQKEATTFFGDRPGTDGPMTTHEERRLDFKVARPVYETLTEIAYSPTGMVWRKGSLLEQYSVLPVKIGDLFRRPPVRAAHRLERAVIVQTDFVYSYGDWVHCFLGVLLSAPRMDVPVVIPGSLAAKGYVRRDLKKAGIDYVSSEGFTSIGEAIVLRKQNPYFYWKPEDVAAFQRAFVSEPQDPAPGSLMYLGRFDLSGETISRHFPSQTVANFVASKGGFVLRQAELTTETAADYTTHAETVIGDHGSGMLNIMFWKPRTVIELVTNKWWVNNTLFVAKGMGIENFAVIEVDNLTEAEIGEKIQGCLDFFSSNGAQLS